MSFQKYNRLWLLISLLTIFSIITIFSNYNFANSSNITQTTANDNNNYYSSSRNISIIVCLNNIYHLHTQLKEEKDKIQIDNILEQVNSTKLKEYVELLSSFHTRHTKSHYIDNVANWLKNEYENICKGRVLFDNYTQSDQNQTYHLKNIICIANDVDISSIDNNTNKQNLSSSSLDTNTMIIGAHYDSRTKNINSTYARAPGADDNASGVSALLEIARIMLSIRTEYTIQFVFFSGEEQGLWGSKHYAKKMKDENKDLLLVLNMDMCGETGFLSSHNTSCIDVDDGSTGIVDENNAMSQDFGQRMEQYAKDHTDLAIQFDPIYASDYMPFEARGYVCIGAYDGSAIDENPHYHTQLDVPENLNMPFLTSVTKMVLAFTILESHYKTDS